MNKSVIPILTLTALFLLSAGCSPNTESSPPNESELIARNIVGGEMASSSFQKENGVVALLIRSKDGEGICTGTLISKKIVLTAAHCLDSTDSAITSVAVIFTQDISKATAVNTRYGVKGLLHNLYHTTAGGLGAWNDIALLKLDEEAPSDVKFAKLPSLLSLNVEAKTSLTQAGFGRTEATRRPSSDTSGLLKKVSGIEVLEVVQSGKELLLKEDGKGSCNGDSGGPAFTKSTGGKLVQVGINSRGTDPASCIGVGVFTHVTAHLKWIKENSDRLMALDTTTSRSIPSSF